MAVQSGNSKPATLTSWAPRECLRRIERREAELSRGFLRSRPERWFPGFAAQWLPLAHSAGLDIRVTEVRPGLLLPRGTGEAYWATLDGEAIGVAVDTQSRQALLEAVTPGARPAAGDVLVEYFARRLIASLAVSWTGPRFGAVQFKGRAADAFHPLGSLKLGVLVNDNPAVVWVLLEAAFVDRLDGLWRRQIQSSLRQTEEQSAVLIEMGRLQVAPPMLDEYLKDGAVLELNARALDMAVLSLAGKPWFPARLCQLDDHLGCEVLSGPPPAADDGAGGLTIAVEFEPITLNAQLVAELSQIGAVWDTALPLAPNVRLTLNGEQIGCGELCVQEGRLVVKVSGR